MAHAESRRDGRPADVDDLRLHTSPVARVVFAGAGCVAVALGTLGIFLPLLPATPFLLLAAYCFARSSERLYTWLLRNRYFGPSIVRWRRHRCVSLRAKRLAVGMTALTFATTVAALDGPWLRLALAVWGIGLIVYLSRLRVCPPGE